MMFSEIKEGIFICLCITLLYCSSGLHVILIQKIITTVGKMLLCCPRPFACIENENSVYLLQIKRQIFREKVTRCQCCQQTQHQIIQPGKTPIFFQVCIVRILILLTIFVYETDHFFFLQQLQMFFACELFVFMYIYIHPYISV